MADSVAKVLEGVFAIKKPPSLSSAQVLRDLQHAFRTSDTFAPLLARTQTLEEQSKQRSKRRRIDNQNVFKMGHGGTLDPLATGVLIVGIGRGTKYLSGFLDCSKTYETVVLFGKSTDTYDVAGKVIASAGTKHITRKHVEEKLDAFRGHIKQVPPVYSALKIDGIKAYDYARSGKELPRELAAREMHVSECTLTDWFEPGEHSYRWPSEEAPDEEKKVFKKLTAVPSNVSGETKHPPTSPTGLDETRTTTSVATPKSQTSSKVDKRPITDNKALSREDRAALHTHELSGLCDEVADTPAARIRLTVSSGFYVRSFTHDLGIACDSFGTMVELARTRQAEFTTADPSPAGLVSAIDHADLAEQEIVWAPKIVQILEDWLAKNPDKEPVRSENQQQRRNDFNREPRSRKRFEQGTDKRRRNSSSPE